MDIQVTKIQIKVNQTNKKLNLNKYQEQSIKFFKKLCKKV